MFKKDRSEKAQEGDSNFAGEIWSDAYIDEMCSSTWKQLYLYIYYRVQNREEAEDITQETYARSLAYLKKRSIDTERYIEFLKKVALNIIRDRWRLKKRQGTSITLDAVNTLDIAAEGSLDDSIRRGAIENALAGLSEEQRRVVELRLLKGYTVSETARLIGKKEVAVRVNQYRALKALARALENYLEDI